MTLSPLLPRQCAELIDDYINAEPAFSHGVASGDPLPDAVVIWTRVSPDADAPRPLAVGWAVAKDARFRRVVARGVCLTDASVDFTVKVDVCNLQPGTTYYYRFHALGHESAIGRTLTARSVAVDRLRFAVASCSNYPYGFFNAYAAIARRSDLDAVLHLGDYLYEYGEGEYGAGAAIGRPVEPAHEILTLDDYRTRHALYKTDPDLQEAHRQHPFITVWDDHETSNDAWREGAENHQPDEGSFEARKAAAIQAYFEWMPIRGQARDGEGNVYRRFSFGELADLILLDTRLVGRDQQVADPCDVAALADPERQLLGAEQEDWFLAELAGSQRRGARWRLVGQQVMFGQLINVLAPGACIFNPDQWDGYPAARARVLTAIAAGGIDNVVVLTGDIHSSWGNDLTFNPFDAAAYDPATGSGSLAVEIVAPAVTSPGIEDPAQAAAFANALRATHPHIKYVELNRRGYALLDVTPERVIAEWYHVARIDAPDPGETLAAALQVVDGENHLSAVPAPSEPRSDSAAPAPAAVSSGA